MVKKEQEFILKQYEMMSQEVLEIHSRTDRLEQFFVAVIGAIYAFAFQKVTGLNDLIFFVPTIISFFVLVRLELLSKVRSILRVKLIEFERELGAENADGGQYQHSQKHFYGTSDAKFREAFAWEKLFLGKVSDRALLWKVSFWATGLAALVANWSTIQSLVDTLCSSGR
ncbi:hypothetical protein [Celeribacter baekdonensis]|uniref:Uncharacterized protein n=1 Tax=Celeribacter baekdonensis B30 TaxID=1208323 RepID=K2J4M2_9RHOB|nr:hypothetical protein [Celeribacter baekdonensis]EKE69998.1 hypothetical protein B30_13964 [Celeribacter baekdonensis B30]